MKESQSDVMSEQNSPIFCLLDFLLRKVGGLGK